MLKMFGCRKVLEMGMKPGDLLPFSAPFPIENSHPFSQFHVCFLIQIKKSNKQNKKKKFFFFYFF